MNPRPVDLFVAAVEITTHTVVKVVFFLLSAGLYELASLSGHLNQLWVPNLNHKRPKYK